jgi:Ni2+-binding GTPase involved in maturation of urease and hydrogenase
MRLIALTGFLGAGKTSTLIALARALEARGERTAVVTNDQGVDLVDTQLVRSSIDAVAEVTGGCFCCRFDDLMAVINRLTEQHTVDTVIVEAVGSCTDLQATVVRPLRAYYGDQFQVAPLVTVLDPLRYRAFRKATERGEPESDLSYLFGRQLAEADLLALNKIDLVSADERSHVLTEVAAANPEAVALGYSATTGEGVDALVTALDGAPTWTGDLEVDYDRYAAAEAQLAWLNRNFEVSAIGSGFLPLAWGQAVLSHLSTAVAELGAEIGHAKIGLEAPEGLTKLSVVASAAEPTVDLAVEEPVGAATASVNARVAVEPAVLDAAVIAAVAAADELVGATSTGADSLSFKPGYPTPVHRLRADAQTA